MSGSMSDLEKDIEASRARLDETIDRIQDRLTPVNLVDEMLGSARQTSLGDVYAGALKAVRANPIPVLLIATGVSLLLNRMSAAGRVPTVRGGAGAGTARPAPAPNAGTERAYDPDQPAGRPARDLDEEARA